jgi:hypothetical protein
VELARFFRPEEIFDYHSAVEAFLYGAGEMG